MRGSNDAARGASTVRLSFVVLLAVGCAAPPSLAERLERQPVSRDAGREPEIADASSEPPTPGARCEPSKPFGAPEPVPGLDAGAGMPRLTSDELTVVYHHDDGIFVATRSTREEPFGTPRLLDELPKKVFLSPAISDDALALYVDDGNRLLKGTRTGTSESFGELVALETPGETINPFLSPGGQPLLAFSRTRGLVWQENDAPFADVPFEGAKSASAPVLTADKRALYFVHSLPSEAAPRWRIKVTRRADANATFESPTDVAELMTDAVTEHAQPSWISADECVLYLSRWRSGVSPSAVMVRRPL